MKRTRRYGWLLSVIAVVLCEQRAVAQADAALGGAGAGASAGAGAGAAGAAGGAAPAPAGNLWSFLCLTKDQKQACKECFCSSAIGQLINNMLKPAAGLTGGLIGPCCPDPATTANPKDLKKPADSAQGAAARIKAEEAEAKAKIAALQYLGTVDCRYYPEAEAAMINSLRAEKNECVRAEAARQLAKGCCCTAKVVKALTICVEGSDKDGFVAERSEFVLAHAYVALERCLRSCMREPEQPPEKPAEAGDGEKKEDDKKALGLRKTGEVYELVSAHLPTNDEMFTPTGYYASVQRGRSEIYREASAVLGRGLKLSQRTIQRLQRPRYVVEILSPPPVPVQLQASMEPPEAAAVSSSPTSSVPTGRRNLADIFGDSLR